jgi:type II secretory pathway predicted ATPase ExeA/tetratricopeptide (TPR) repeat protein
MYLSQYKLLEKPFNISTDPRFLWCGEKHQEALATLKYGLLEPNGYVVLTGEVGTGKTTLVNALIETLGDNVLVANINNPVLDIIEFFNQVAKIFDASAEIATKTEFLFFINSFLQKSHAEGKVVLLIIDEAHRLTKELLEEIRLLSNIEQAGTKLISIFFVGQNELKELLLSVQCTALLQRITLFYDIEPLSEDETREYVFHRLKVAGTDEQLFTTAAICEIQKFTRGYPRLINILCDRAMLTGYVREQEEIDVDIVMECSREISFLEPKVSIEPTKGVDIFLNWGRALVARSRANTAELKKTQLQKKETPENKSYKVKSLNNADRQIAGPNVKKNRLWSRLIGLAGLFALIIVAIGINMNTKSPVKDYATKGFTETNSDQPTEISVLKNTPTTPVLPRKEVHSVTGRQMVEAQKGKSQTLREDANKVLGERDDSSNVVPVKAKTPLSEKVHESAFSADTGHPTHPQATVVPVADKLKLQQPTTFELLSAALEKNNFQIAIDLLESLEKRDNESYLTFGEMYSRALVGRAKQLLASSPVEAEVLLLKAAEVNPKNIEAHFNLGKIYIRSKDYSLAIDAYQNAITLNPKLSDALFNLGFIYATIGMYEDAEKLYARLVPLDPTYLDKALFNLAVVQEKLGKKEESLANLKMAVTIRPENKKAQSHLKLLLEAVEEAPN